MIFTIKQINQIHIQKTQVDALIPTDYVKDEDLSTVAMSGSYNDLTDKPTIVTFRQW